MTERPGFMLYFDLMPALDLLKDEEAGRLFRALMAYGQYGELKELSGSEAVAFQMLRPRMDRDRAAYAEKCLKNTYATYVREIRRQGGVPLEYEDWVSNDIERYPTITVTQFQSQIQHSTAAVQPHRQRTATPRGCCRIWRRERRE